MHGIPAGERLYHEEGYITLEYWQSVVAVPLGPRADGAPARGFDPAGP